MPAFDKTIEEIRELLVGESRTDEWTVELYLECPANDNQVSVSLGEGREDVDAENFANYLVEHILPVVDRRRATNGETEIGAIVVSPEGTVVDHSIEDKYLKPKAQSEKKY